MWDVGIGVGLTIVKAHLVAGLPECCRVRGLGRRGAHHRFHYHHLRHLRLRHHLLDQVAGLGPELVGATENESEVLT